MDCKTSDRKSYCYARKIYKRFRLDEQVWLDISELHQPFKGSPKGIFVCSTFELFHPKTKDLVSYNFRIPHKVTKMRNLIFDVIEKNPQHRFYILTKLPQNIDRPMPPNVWLGTTITGLNNDFNNWIHLAKATAILKFISFEPILSSLIKLVDTRLGAPNLVVLGRLTGFDKKYDPSKDLIMEISELSKFANIKVFLKNNLISILGEKFVKEHQEMPKEQP
jgi:protein gp37